MKYVSMLSTMWLQSYFSHKYLFIICLVNCGYSEVACTVIDDPKI